MNKINHMKCNCRMPELKCIKCGKPYLWNKNKSKMNHIFEEIAAERQRQNDKWGEQNHSMLNEFMSYRACKSEESYYRDINKKEDYRFSWLTILLKEVYEAFAEIDPVKQREELIQTAAMVVQIIECIDRQIDGGKGC